MEANRFLTFPVHTQHPYISTELNIELIVYDLTAPASVLEETRSAGSRQVSSSRPQQLQA